MAENSFADMLNPGETVLAELAGEGRPVERGSGIERTWWHVALTRDRLLVLRMRAAPGTDRWEVIARLAGLRASLRIAHYPRTAADSARLTIDGCGDRIVYIDVDRPPLMQQVAAFLSAWGGPVAGGDSVAQEELDAYHGDQPKDQKTFLLIAGGMLALFVVCCGCAGGLALLRAVLSGVLGVG
jgi:hypothetical protein